MLNESDINRIKEIGDGRWRKIEDCEETVERSESADKIIQADINSLKINFAKSNTKLSILIAILTAIAGPLISVCIKFLFRG